ncbi:hypothetical protein QYE76_018638 [Lolium multiflorum]|uniref:CCHC-type domain-containing protein n=1 Tax=Lolium multiflorum TaxID=4521 RepID=A0AAD8QH84_LOLMU|nr:hypothetical protein QYE76_018638 [Lolium multiflorum]
MTVGGSGDCGGDSCGDFATASPVRESSPEWLRGSRFWLLQASDDEEDGGDLELSPGAADSDRSLMYLCRTPSPVSDIDIVDDSRELARRTTKRITKRNAQRMATKASMVFASPEGKASSSSMPLGRGVTKIKSLAIPVMEPSIFIDDDDGGWTVVRRRRWPPVIPHDIPDPKNLTNSKSSEISGLGLARVRASPTTNPVHWNPLVTRNRRLQRERSDGDLEPRQVRVGASIAGHAFRKLLGFSWRKKEPGEPVWRRSDLPSTMNGDGGRGGFNPGRGTINAGRGGRAGYQGRGYQGRGGFQARGGFQGCDSRKRHRLQLRVAGRGMVVAAIMLIKQTVQAVVAAVTAANKVNDTTQGAPTTTVVTGGTGQQETTSVATSNAVPQATIQVQDNQGTGSKVKENEGQGPQKKKEEKTGCFRCKQPGHHIDDCPTPFCDLCESVHHATHACHLHQSPKPTAILHGYANEALMFFELACGAFKAKVENPRLPKVTVEGEAMTIPEIIEQLKKIVPCDKFNWEIFHLKDNIYRVKLPKEANEVQEVDMVEIDNGGDGNDGAASEEQNKEGGNAMDMDPKGQDDTNNSNNGGQSGASISDGVQGMQLAQSIQEINIGAIKVPLSPTDSAVLGSPFVASGSESQVGSKSWRAQAEDRQVLSPSGASNELWRIILEGFKPYNPDKLTRREAVDSQLNNTALHMIQTSVGTQELPRVRNYTTAKEAWDGLAASCIGSESTRRNKYNALRNQAEGFMRLPDEDHQVMYGRLLIVADAFRLCGATHINDSWIKEKYIECMMPFVPIDVKTLVGRECYSSLSSQDAVHEMQALKVLEQNSHDSRNRAIGMAKGNNLALVVNPVEEVYPQEQYRASWSMSYPEDLECHYHDHMAFHAKSFWVDPSKAKEDNIKRNHKSGFTSFGPKTRSCYNCDDKRHFIAECPYENRELHNGRLIPKDKSKDTKGKYSKAPNKKFYNNKTKKGKRPPRVVLVTREEYSTDEIESSSDDEGESSKEVAAIVTTNILSSSLFESPNENPHIKNAHCFMAKSSLDTSNVLSTQEEYTSGDDDVDDEEDATSNGLVALASLSTNSSSPSESPNVEEESCLMAKSSEVSSPSPSMPNISSDLGVDDASLKVKQEMLEFDEFIFNLQGNNKKHVSNLMARLAQQNATLEKKGQIEREDSLEIHALKNALEESQETIASLEERLENLEEPQDEINKLTKARDHARAKTKLLKKEMAQFGVDHEKLVKDLDELDKAHKALKSEYALLSKSNEQLQIRLASYDVPSSSTPSCDHANIIEENARLKDELAKASSPQINFLWMIS